VDPNSLSDFLVRITLLSLFHPCKCPECDHVCKDLGDVEFFSLNSDGSLTIVCKYCLAPFVDLENLINIQEDDNENEVEE